jgi:hypothetical protein
MAGEWTLCQMETGARLQMRGWCRGTKHRGLHHMNLLGGTSYPSGWERAASLGRILMSKWAS